VYSWNPATTIPSIRVWDETFTGLHGASRISVSDPSAPWAARLEWQQSRTYGLALCTGSGQEVDRQTRHIKADPRGACELLVPLTGSAWMAQGPSSTEIRPGQLALCDADQPYTFAHETGFRSIALIVPQQDITRRSPAAGHEPQLLSGTGGLGRVIRQLVVTLQEEREALSETAFDLACDQLLDLVCLAAEGATAAPHVHRDTVEADIRRYIRRHATDNELDVTSIARALGWSPRYIQQVLQEANTTSRELIRQERLRLARARLAGKTWAPSSIAQVAHSCGFRSHAAFATAFRQEFGMTPSDCRSGA